ncbi:putative Leukocyte receptor cluster member 8-like protein [Hypsibius exemplaris]|uniref:Leukocyte receptor cluster member 8-like protein n=1 Tax=Hypsibius exemplaris TaxID=2072580 RepID=A0A9X6ND67_HYPEX|nr:putative Leukocyte receptor cluster member 8-like protein [Hypsibius exemplaris]
MYGRNWANTIQLLKGVIWTATSEKISLPRFSSSATPLPLIHTPPPPPYTLTQTGKHKKLSQVSRWMMDIGYIPAPPPEEFEETGAVPLPPPSSDWDNGNGSPYVSSTSSQSNNGAAWQVAMDALSQTQPAKPFGHHHNPYSGAPAYGQPMMPPPNWPPPSYGYASNYQPSYSTQPNSMYAGGQFNLGQGLGYAQQQQQPRHPSPYPPQQPPPPQQQQQTYSPQQPPPQQSYSQPPSSCTPSSSLYSNPPPPSSSPQSSTVAPPTAFTSRTAQNNFGRPRMARPRYAPYPSYSAATPSPAAPSSSMMTGGQSGGGGSATYVQSSPQAGYSAYLSGPPPDAAAHHASGSSSTAAVDMDTEESEAMAAYHTTGSHKQAPGAGGIRFQLSKKSAEVKVSNPLLQRRSGPHLPPSRLSTNTDSTNGSGASSSSQPTLNTPDLLSNVQSRDWPASLQEYVTKAIRITPPEKHERVMHTITQMITTAYKTNTIFTAKWETAPMPYASETANELFGLSPKRENESPPHSSSSFRSRFTPSNRGRGGGGTRNSDNVRRGRISGHRSGSESADEGRGHYGSSSSKYGNSEGGRASSRWDSQEKNASPEVDFLPLHGAGKGTPSKKGKLLKQGKTPVTPAGPRGKLMGFGVEQPKSAEDLDKLRKRRERFSAAGDATTSPGVKPLAKPKKSTSKSPARVIGARRALSTVRTVVGTCQTVEKEYFRLTEAVDASQVRPLPILQEALQMVKDKWKKEHNYRYAESQLKSIRQDLRVQHVFSPFTVQVYETHARIALEVGDQAEFTQCLAQLEWLYDTLTAVHRRGADGKADVRGSNVAAGCENRLEFLSYRILYVMRQNRTTDVTRVRTQLSDSDKKDPCIAFAFSVLSAYFAGDYQQFFSLFKIAPLMAGYVMEVSIPQFRQRIFVKICTAYRPNLPVMALKEILRFPNDAELRDFLRGYKLTYTWLNESEEIDCKASLPVVKAGPEVVTDAPPAKPQPVSVRPTSKTRRKFKV